jgi:Flp pilus assembly protein TadG
LIPIKNKLGSRRGNAMIEFAAAAGILIPLLLGTFQFGYTFYVYNVLCTQMRAGARYASLKKFKGSDVSGFKTAVKSMVLYGDPYAAAGSKVLEPGLTANQIDVEIKASDGTTDASATVVPTTVWVTTAGGDNGYTVDAVITKFTFSGKPIVTFPYVGQYAPAE